MAKHRFYVIVCDYGSDGTVEEFEMRSWYEKPLEALDRLKACTFEPLYVLECIPGELCEDCSEEMALLWFRELQRDGWMTGDTLPDFVWRHLPASVDVGYRPFGDTL